MPLFETFSLLFLGLLAWLWHDSLQARDAGVREARTACSDEGCNCSTTRWPSAACALPATMAAACGRSVSMVSNTAIPGTIGGRGRSRCFGHDVVMVSLRARLTLIEGGGMSSIEELRAALLRFRDERDWQQFHTLRNLIVSLNLEAGELLNSPSGAATRKCVASSRNRPAGSAGRRVCRRPAFYLILVADSAGIDLVEAARRKLARNADRYPVDKCRGSSVKYDRL